MGAVRTWEATMRYLLLIYDDAAAFAQTSDEDTQAEIAEYMAFTEAITAEGIMRGGEALQPPATATTVRMRDGETLLSDGPFAETHEQLGGYYMVECDTLDQAIGAAKRIPGARHGSIEVRPIMELRLTGGDTEAVARVFREEYGRAVATLARILGDIDRAEDAIQDAFAIAIDRWPREGTPRRPLAWIVTTARNRAIDAIRAERTRSGSEAARLRLLEGTAPDELDNLGSDTPIPDERLGLIFACCHPSLALDARVPLTLRLVAGLTVPQIGRALLLPEATVAQRLVRAKRKIRDAAIPIGEPPADELPERIGGVLAVLYLTYAEGYSATGGTGLRRDDLAEEAIRLAERPARPDARRSRAARPARPDDAPARPAAGAGPAPTARWYCSPTRTGASGIARRSRGGPHSSNEPCACAARRAPTRCRPPSRPFTRRPSAPRPPTGLRSSPSTTC